MFLESFAGGKRGLFFLVFAAVTLALVGSSFFVILFVREQVRVPDEASDMQRELSLIYVDYFNEPSDYVSADSYLAMGRYAQDHPEPQNVEVLTDLATHEINGYMLNHFVSGMSVNCTYCHYIDVEQEIYGFQCNDADTSQWPECGGWEDETAMANKAMARTHLRMSKDLNENWLTQLAGLTPEKQPSGAQITCATCHYGQAVPVVWEENQVALPDDFRLRLDEDVVYSTEEDGHLNITANYDVSLREVQYNQDVMYHMNQSMNVGCTHCHNSRYFPSNEVPAKHYSMNMLQMTQYIWLEWGEEALRGTEPNCTMCHNQAVIPPGSARSASVLPASLVDEEFYGLTTDEMAMNP